MAAKRYWRLTSVTLLVYALVGLIAVKYRGELRWAADEFPRYVQGRIGVPEERRLYRRAKTMIQEHRDLEAARSLLERSIAIDPYSDAVYWLGEYHLAAGHDREALEQLMRYLEFDPTRVDAYTTAATILQAEKRQDEARALLARGLSYFTSHRPDIEPRPDPGVTMRYNQKAIELHAYCESAIARLTEALSRLAESREGAASAGPDGR